MVGVAEDRILALSQRVIELEDRNTKLEARICDLTNELALVREDNRRLLIRLGEIEQTNGYTIAPGRD